MIRKLPFVAVLAFLLGVSVRADEKADAEMKALVGVWKVNTSELGGDDVTDFLKDLTLDIREGGKYLVEFGKSKDVGTFTVDAAKNPKTMTIKPTEGPNKGKTIKGIYKLDGNTLTICYDLNADKSEFPEKFESKKDTKLLLTTYKRDKK